MFDTLSEKFSNIFKGFSRNKKLTQDNISDAVRQVRLALLDADVNYGVTKTLIQNIKEKSLGEKLLDTLRPDQQFIKIVHDELVKIMGEGESTLALASSPTKILICGLQGSGKTTFCAKLGLYLKKKTDKKHPLLVACDLQRPAAVLQLQMLGEKAGVSVFTLPGEKDPVKVAFQAISYAKEHGHNAIIFDTAGRLHIDDELMEQLENIKKKLQPEEVLFVANAALGQDAVRTAEQFNQRLGVTGSVLTMLDGDARGGAAISIHQVTQKPLKFESIGEQLSDIQLFNPQSMADRILGMGDTINLVKKAQEYISEKEAQDLEKKIKKASFTYGDYLKQMQVIKKMGSIKSLFKMIPGVGKSIDLDKTTSDFKGMEAIIYSMTLKERDGIDDLSLNRMKRIARGSGVALEKVMRMKKSFKKMKTLFKGSNKNQLDKMMGGLKRYGA